jgi:hypothetical protein
VEQINLVQAKGGQGTSVTACAVAVAAAAKGRRVRLDGHDRATLAAILGTYGDGPVSANLVLGTDSGEQFDLVVNDGPADRGTTLLVTRPCYLALRAAMNLEVTAAAAGVVVVSEAGRALDARDVADVTGLPVVTIIPVRAEIGRAVDAGILGTRLPKDLEAPAGEILEFLFTATGREVR